MDNNLSIKQRFENFWCSGAQRQVGHYLRTHTNNQNVATKRQIKYGRIYWKLIDKILVIHAQTGTFSYLCQSVSVAH